MSKKIISIIVAVVVIFGFVAYWFLFKPKKQEIKFQKVDKGDVVQQVSETGSVKLSNRLNIGFKYAGRINKLYVSVGDKVRRGDILATLDTSQLEIQLEADKANLAVVESKKTSGKISLTNTEQALKDAQDSANEKISSVYEDALNVLNSSYLKIYDSSVLVSKVNRVYFTTNDQEGRKVSENTARIENALKSAKYYLDEAEKERAREKIDAALAEFKKDLEITRDSLGVIRDMAETIAYRNVVSSASKTSLDNQKAYIISALNNVVNTQQTISSAKIVNKKNIDAVEAKISLLKSELKKGGLYDSQISQVEADIRLLKDKIAQSVLRAPDNGEVVDINKRPGEVVQPTMPVISFLPSGRFQIEVYIYEGDIPKVKIGDKVLINMTAFPDKTFNGRVVAIDPAEKIIEDVVYYKVTIDFNKEIKGLKPGMTADITIETAKKENVLRVPKELVEDLNGEKFVRLYKNGETIKKKIETGLEGNDYIEVLSGLKQSDKIY